MREGEELPLRSGCTRVLPLNEHLAAEQLLKGWGRTELNESLTVCPQPPRSDHELACPADDPLTQVASRTFHAVCPVSVQEFALCANRPEIIYIDTRF